MRFSAGSGSSKSLSAIAQQAWPTRERFHSNHFAEILVSMEENVDR